METDDPGFITYHRDLPVEQWDLHVLQQLISPAFDTGSPTFLDPDGSTSDMGAYGGDTADFADWFTYYVDGDGDGLYDGWETRHLGGTEVSDGLFADSDGDGKLDVDELAAGTDPASVDTDGDGTTDDLDGAALNPGAS